MLAAFRMARSPNHCATARAEVKHLIGQYKKVSLRASAIAYSGFLSRYLARCMLPHWQHAFNVDFGGGEFES